MRSLLFVLVTTLLIVTSARSDDRWWVAPLTGYPMATGVEVRIDPGTPHVTGMSSIAAPAPSPFITPKTPPVVDPPPKLVIRPVYLPKTYARPATRRVDGTGVWTRSATRR